MKPTKPLPIDPRLRFTMVKQINEPQATTAAQIRRPNSAPPRGRLPLTGKIFYLDLSDKKKTFYAQQIEYLGGGVSRELDFSRISHVLTSRSPRAQSPSPAAASNNANMDPKSLLSRQNHLSLTKSAGSIPRPASPAAAVLASLQGASKRSQKLAEVLLSTQAAQESSIRHDDILALAKQYDKTIYHVDNLGPWLRTQCEKLLLEREALRAAKKRSPPDSIAPTEAAHTEMDQQPAGPILPTRAATPTPAPQPPQQRPTALIRSPTPMRLGNPSARNLASNTTPAAPKHPQIVVKDKMGHFPPAIKEFAPIVLQDGSEQPSFPVLHVENPPGASLFAYMSPQDRETEMEKVRARKRKYMESNSTPELRREFEEARRKKLKVKPDKENLLNFPLRPKSGYCECCCKKYDDFDTHMADESHRQFATDAKNYAELDHLIEEVNSGVPPIASSTTAPLASS